MKYGGKAEPGEEEQENQTWSRSPLGVHIPSLITKAKDKREGRKVTHLGMNPVIYACCTDNIRPKKKKGKKKKLRIIFPHTLAAVYIPCQCLSTGELFAIRWGKGREGDEKCQRKPVFKSSGFIQ